MNLNIFKKTSQKGFTLIEMIVSLAIFTIVAVVAIGALLKILDANRKSINLKNATNNINFALESMTRELRVGGDYQITYTANDWVIDFRPSKSDVGCDLRYAYKYDHTKQTIQKAQSICGGLATDFQDLISPEVKITSSDITIANSPYGRIDIQFTGYAGIKDKDKTYFDIQTSVSQAIL